MNTIGINISKTLGTLTEKEISSLKPAAKKSIESLLKKSGKGNDFLGWITLPSEIKKPLIEDMEKVAAGLRKNSEIVVVVGIGGSYLGARAVIDSLSHNFSNLLNGKKGNPLVVYAGQNIGEDYMCDLLDVLNKKDYSLIVISKSGTTTEPALAFRVLKQHIEEKYGSKKAVKRIVAITDEKRGALKELANKEGYKTYVIPDDVGGRFSVLTPVGLLPIAVAGFNIGSLVKGAKAMQQIVAKTDKIEENPAAVYAIVRNLLYNKGKKVEILASYVPNLNFIIEWWKQLYGESEGKEGKGIFPAGVNFTTDLHSMGQYIQDGERMLFETVISVESNNRKMLVPKDKKDLDKLNFLAGRKINDVNSMAILGTQIAHVDGGVPNIQITVPKLNEEYLGQLIYFFEFACGVSGYILDVNPFNQPGVEAYKKNMFALLGKPGFEKETAAIKKRIS